MSHTVRFPQGNVLLRNLSRDMPVISHGEGIYLFDRSGKRYIDASSGALVVSVGHGNKRVADAIHAQLVRVGYVNGTQFTSEATEALATRLAGLAAAELPGAGLSRVAFLSSGSEVVEAAVKFARQLWVERGQPQRTKFIARLPSYHGNTLYALSISGRPHYKKLYGPMLSPVVTVSSPYPYRSGLADYERDGAEHYARELEATIEREGPGTIAAFIAEPVIGSSAGAAVPPPGYFERLRQLCDKHGILMIADEVLCGAGRCGSFFASRPTGFRPDILVIGKGLGGGCAPVSALLVRQQHLEEMQAGSGYFQHAQTYLQAPFLTAAGLAVLDEFDRLELVENAARVGARFLARLRERLLPLPFVGCVQGLGLLAGVELVADKTTRAPFDRARHVTEKLVAHLFARGLIVWPNVGHADGVNGDLFMLGPPLCISEAEADALVDGLAAALAEFTTELTPELDPMAFRITYSVLDGEMAAIHKEFDTALASVRGELGATYPAWIAGEPVESGELHESRAPADTRLLLAKFHRTPVAALPRAVKVAREAQQRWVALGWKERVARIRKAAELISERRMRLAAIMALEAGKSRMESLGDVEESADLLRYYAGNVEEANGFERPLGKLSPREDTRDVLRPYGVFAVVSPFNFPMALPTGMSGAALLAGNAVILKPAEATAWCGQLLFEIFRDAGLPTGLFQLVHGSGRVIASALVRQPGIDGVAFTGSTEVGMELHRVMSEGRIRPALLEMGGKNACIVTESADLAAAIQGCARSAFGLSGQKCSALSRIFVARSRHKEFVEGLAAKAKTLVVGDPTRQEVYMGPVIDARAVATYERAAAEARKDGTVHCGGTRLTEGALAHGYFVAPTVVSVPRGHRLSKEELFLPFVTVEPFDGFDEAIGLANDVDYGLTGGIFSQDAKEIEAFMARAEAGVLYANRETGATTGAWPGVQSFCGWKGSGSTGKGGCGPYYVSQFAREQSQTRMAPVSAGVAP